MKRVAAISTLVLLAATLPAAAQQREPGFATQEQINLLLSQSERALDSWEANIKVEEQLLPAEAAKDRESLATCRELMHTLKQSPSSFNGPWGFLLVVALDNVSRDSAVSALLALTQSLARHQKAEVVVAKLKLSDAFSTNVMTFKGLHETSFHMYYNALLATDKILKQQPTRNP